MLFAETVEGIDKNSIIPLGTAVIVFQAVILTLFIYKSRRKRRNIPFLIGYAFFGLVYWIFQISFIITTPDNPFSLLGEIRETILLCQIIMLFFFFDSMFEIRPNPYLLSALVALSVLYCAFYYYIYDYAVHTFFLLLLNMLVDGGCGIPIFYRMFRVTREKTALALLAGMILITYGQFITGIRWSIFYLNTPPLWIVLDSLSWGGIMLGVLTISLTYVIRIDYTYRLPNNYYMLLVMTSSGLTIHHVIFKSGRTIKIDETLLAGFLTAINSMFVETLEVKHPLENILSKDATILMKRGKWITVAIVGDTASAMLENALKRHVKDFEAKYGAQLAENMPETSQYNSATELISQVFPFFKVLPKENKANLQD